MSVSIFMANIGPPETADLLKHPYQPSFSLYKAKLSGVFRQMALIGGFCVSSMAELKGYETSPSWLVTSFSVITVLLTSMTAFVILSAGYLLPYMSANEELDNTLVETGLIRNFKSHRLFFLPREIQIVAQITWLTANTGIVFLFLVDMMLITWIKFHRISNPAAISGTTVISPTILLMIYFAVRFWREFLQRRIVANNYCAD